MFGGEAEGGGGAAGGAVEDGDEEGGSLHHGAVAAEHAAGSIDRLEHLDCAAGGKERVVARLLLGRPAVFLRGARDHGRKDRLRRSPGGAAGKDGLGKILVAAAGHAAQEGPEAAVIDLLHRAAQQDLQRPAAWVVLVPAPGQMLRPVAGKGADHGGFPPRRVFHSIAKKQPLYKRPPACYDEDKK